MSGFGKCLGYRNTPCPNCGRYRLEHYSEGYDICEKCEWCVQLGKYIDYFDTELFEEDGMDVPPKEGEA